MFLPLTLWLWLSVLAHPIHVSLSELNYNAPELTLEISHRMFYDDLERAMERQCNCAITLDAKTPSANVDSVLRRYIAPRVLLMADGVRLTPKFLGVEYDADALWVHYEASDLRPFTELTIEQNLLFELYPDQSSLVNFTCSGQLRSARLHAGQTSERLPCGRR